MSQDITIALQVPAGTKNVPKIEYNAIIGTPLVGDVFEIEESGDAFVVARRRWIAKEDGVMLVIELARQP